MRTPLRRDEEPDGVETWARNWAVGGPEVRCGGTAAIANSGPGAMVADKCPDNLAKDPVTACSIRGEIRAREPIDGHWTMTMNRCRAPWRKLTSVVVTLCVVVLAAGFPARAEETSANKPDLIKSVLPTVVN